MDGLIDFKDLLPFAVFGAFAAVAWLVLDRVAASKPRALERLRLFTWVTAFILIKPISMADMNSATALYRRYIAVKQQLLASLNQIPGNYMMFTAIYLSGLRTAGTPITMVRLRMDQPGCMKATT